MREAVLRVDGDLLAAHGFQFEAFREAGVRDAEILSCEGSRGVLRLTVESELDPGRLDEMDAIRWWDRVDGGSAVVYLLDVGATDAPDDAGDGGLRPRCERVTVTDRGLSLTDAAPHDRIGDLVADLETDRSGVAIDRLRDYRTRPAPLAALTARQREVLETAFERGYYEIPRETSVDELAAVLDVDDSTVTEHLQRAERNLLESLLGSSG